MPTGPDGASRSQGLIMTRPPLRLHTLLVLGRTSNLPTVWSNCLAAWLISGAGNWYAFLWLGLGASLLYLGGMFLNDAFDVEFDRQFRSERPIPAGHISAWDVWWYGGLLLFIGWLLLFILSATVAGLALALVAAIIGYDAIHKRTEFAPFLMALCRFLLYLVAGAATLHELRFPVIGHGAALGAYIVGLSFVARGESKPGGAPVWPLLLVAAPLIANVWIEPVRNVWSWLAAVALLLWLIKCLWPLRRAAKPNVGRLVAALLAGIVLVDAAAVATLSFGALLGFAALFSLALLFQKVVPAT